MSYNSIGLLKANGEVEEYGNTGSSGGANFSGTIEEWNSLTTEQQNQYDTIDITNDNEGMPGDRKTVTGNPLSFDTASSQVSTKTVVTLEPIQAGSGDPSPSNVRAISGYDSINVAVPRKNLFNINAKYITRENTSGTYTISGNTLTVLTTSNNATAVCGFIIPVNIGNKYTISFSVNTGENEVVRCATLDIPESSISYSMEELQDSIENGDTIIAEHSYLLIGFLGRRESQGGARIYSNIQIEEGSTTTYEPYNPVTDITIPAPDGTIYGGTLDVESGLLTVDRAGVDMGSLTWQKFGTYYLTTQLRSIAKNYQLADSKILCSMFKIPSATGVSGDTIYIDNTGDLICRPSATYQDAEAFTTAVTGQKLVYELATPKTYHLSPHQVKLLQGANTVTTNGTSLQLTYREGEIAQLSDLSGLADSIEGIAENLSKNSSFGESISLSSGDTLQKDGYVTAFYNNSSSGERNLKINGVTVYVNSYTPSSGFISYSIFAKKGMVVTFTNCGCSFTPII